MFWGKVCNKQLGFKIRRQEVILGWIVDFYCAPLRFAVELDGGYHDSPPRVRYDAKRDRAMGRRGIKVLRIRDEVFQSRPNKTLAALRSILLHRSLELQLNRVDRVVRVMEKREKKKDYRMMMRVLRISRELKINLKVDAERSEAFTKPGVSGFASLAANTLSRVSQMGGLSS